MIDKYHQVWENITVSPLLPTFWIFFLVYCKYYSIFIHLIYGCSFVAMAAGGKRKNKKRETLSSSMHSGGDIDWRQRWKFSHLLMRTEGPCAEPWIRMSSSAWSHPACGVRNPSSLRWDVGKMWPVQVRGPLSCLSRENHPRKIGGVPTYPATPIHFTHWAADCPRKY